MPIPFVVMKWTRANETREHKKYTSELVNNFLATLKATQSRPVRLVCVTDDAAGLDSEIEAIPITPRVRETIDSHGEQFCKLYLFSSDFRKIIGRAFIYSDLDVAILSDLTYLYGGGENLVIMEGENGDFLYNVHKINGGSLPSRRSFRLAHKLFRHSSLGDAFRYLMIRPKNWCRFNSSFMVVSADQPDDLWSDFSPEVAMKEIRLNRVVGSDQAWLHLHKAGKIKTVGSSDGFWRRREVDRYLKKTGTLPLGLKMVIFAGKHSKPWTEENARVDWIRQVTKTPTTSAQP